MVNHILIARIFLIGLAAIAIYTVASAKTPDDVDLIPCVFHSITDVPCPGCGMTRACLSITHGNLTDAWRYHPLAFVLVGLSLGFAFFPTSLMAAWNRQSNKTKNLISISGIVICLSVWLMKLRSIF